MREKYDGQLEDTCNPDIESEIGGRGIWYSSCDSQLLVYSGK